MKTEIIVKTGWHKIAEYDYLITLSKDDVIEMVDGFEYRVDCCVLSLGENKMTILVY